HLGGSSRVFCSPPALKSTVGNIARASPHHTRMNRVACNIRPMAKPPGKRGQSRTSTTSGKSGDSPRSRQSGKQAAGGKRLPPWMPDVAANPPRGGRDESSGRGARGTKPLKDIGKTRRDAKGRIQD